MNKKQLAEEIAKDLPMIPKSKILKAVDVFLDTILETLIKGEAVKLSGFGTFYLGQRQEKRGVNPRTKQPIVIPAATLPKFRAGGKLKEKVR